MIPGNWRLLPSCGKPARHDFVKVLFLAVALLLGGPAIADGEPTKLRFTPDWIPGSVHGPFFIALYRGYYRDEGLDVGGRNQVAYGTGDGE
jgi:ABC-type nitrate/sulfonate/bicarbonate transport system substrate-binding protein